MISRLPRPLAAFGLAALVMASVALTGCRKKEPAAPPMATPSVSLNHERTPLGSPVDIKYKFVVAPDAQFSEDLRVMVHVVDADEKTEERMRQAARTSNSRDSGKSHHVILPPAPRRPLATIGVRATVAPGLPT